MVACVNMTHDSTDTPLLVYALQLFHPQETAPPAMNKDNYSPTPNDDEDEAMPSSSDVSQHIMYASLLFMLLWTKACLRLTHNTSLQPHTSNQTIMTLL